MRTITVNGREYTLEGNPKMGTVRYVEEMEIELMRKYIDDDAIVQMESSDNAADSLLENIEVDDLKTMMWERSAQEPLQTICLATNERLTIDELEEMRANDFLELKEASEEALGGTASDFTERLGLGISSQVKEIREQLESEDEESPSLQNLPPSVSSHLREQ